jgi:hypothetical protein
MTELSDDLDIVSEAYTQRFRLPPPNPYAIGHRTIARALQTAITSGEPILDDYDWHGDWLSISA